MRIRDNRLDPITKLENMQKQSQDNEIQVYMEWLKHKKNTGENIDFEDYKLNKVAQSLPYQMMTKPIKPRLKRL